MNSIVILGRLTRDIEVSTTSNGVKLARFTVAVPSEIKSSGGERQTDFFVCVAWRDAAENIAKNFKKGEPICLVGSMNCRSYQNDGKKQNIWEFNVKSFAFVPNRYEKRKEGSDNEEVTPIEDDDNLPF